jgi:hypothetical protein
MSRALRWAGLLLVSPLLLAGLAAQEKKDARDEPKKDGKEPSKTAPAEKLVPLRQILAKIHRVDAEQKVLHVEINQTFLDIVASEDVQVRVKEPPTSFDEKGNIIKPTAEELKKLKGDPNLPGYLASFEALRPGQIVTVALARKASATGIDLTLPPPPSEKKPDPKKGKTTAKDRTPPPDKTTVKDKTPSKDKTAAKPPPARPDNRLRFTVVYIEEEPK